MRVFIGAAWPYATGPRHLGHVAGVYLPADVLARYHRLAGDDVLFVSGTDQHGTPVTIAAERAGLDPVRFADVEHDAIARSFADLGVSFDIYTKTSTPLHADVTQGVLRVLTERGFVTEGTARNAFCPVHERSLPDRYVIGGCPRCGAADARGDQCDTCGTTLEPENLTKLGVRGAAPRRSSERCASCSCASTFSKELSGSISRGAALPGLPSR